MNQIGKAALFRAQGLSQASWETPADAQWFAFSTVSGFQSGSLGYDSLFAVTCHLSPIPYSLQLMPP